MKKRVLAVILGAVMTMSLAACGSSDAGKTSSDDGEKSYTIGISQFAEHGSLDNCREGFLEGLKEEGIEEGKNLTVEVKNAAADQGTAKQISDGFVSDKVDLVCAIATPSAQAAYNSAMNSDIPVVQTADISLATDELLTEVDCLTNLTDNTVVASLATILDKANKQNIPVFGSEIEQVKIGCLAAEGLDYVALGKQTGKMAAEILKGEKKASDMNFETITEPGFYVNEKVAENLGVTVPQDLADEAVESFTEITKQY